MRILIALLLSLVCAVAGSAQELSGNTPSPLHELVTAGLSANRDSVEAQHAYNRALRDREGEAAYESSVLSGSVRATAAGSTEVSATASLSVPIVDQLTLSSGITVDPEVSGTLGASLRPLATTATADLAAEEQYLRAVIALDAATLTIAGDLEEAILAYGASGAAAAYAEASVTLQEEIFQIVSQEYALGEATYLDVDDARDNLDQARNAWSQAQRSRLTLQQNLASLFALTDDFPELPVVPADQLITLTAAKTEVLEAARNAGSQPWSQTLESQRITVDILTERRSATMLLRPDLTVSASTDTAFRSPSVSLSVSFSPSQWARDDRSDLDEDIADARIRLAIEEQSLALEENLVRRLIEIADRDSVIARSDLDRAILDLSETQVLFSLGERTSVELRQGELTVESRTRALYQALLDLNGALNDALVLYGIDWYAASGRQ